MATFSTTQPSLRARVLPKFPAQVLAGNGITITRQGAAYVFAVTALVEVPLSTLAPQAPNTVVGRGAGIGPPSALGVGGGLVVTGANSVEMSPNQRARGLSYEFTSIAPGSIRHIAVPLACTITKITLLCNAPAGNCVLDFWKNTFATWLSPNSITGGVKPSLVAQSKAIFTNFATWDTHIGAGDIISINVDSVSVLTVLVVSVEVSAI